MAVTVADLQERFPEFKRAPATLVSRCIEDAQAKLSPTVYGSSYDMAVRYLAAHLIAINPVGEMARLDKKGNVVSTTTYLDEFKVIQKSVTFGYRVI